MRWQAQEEEGAVLRDQVKQAAHLWEEKGRPDDLLWTGTAFREFELWRERYPGKLTALEEDFARAMVERARRRRRVQRAVIATTIVVLLVVLTVIGTLWRRSVAEARRAEAAGLFSLAQGRLEDHPTEALAYATASLERADDPEVRHLLLAALWRGPTEIRLAIPPPLGLDFSPDGRWMAARRPWVGPSNRGGALWPSDGGPPVTLEAANETMELRFSPKGDLVAGQMDTERLTLGVWSVPEGRLLRSFSTAGLGRYTNFFKLSPDGRQILTSTAGPKDGRGELAVQVWPVEGGAPDLLARFEVPFESAVVWPSTDLDWTRLAWADGRTARIARIEDGKVNAAAAQSIEHDRTLSHVLLDDAGRTLLTAWDGGKSGRIWSLERDPPRLVRTLTGPDDSDFRFDPTGSLLASSSRLWDLRAPPETEPRRLPGCNWALGFDPGGRWLATTGGSQCFDVSLWPLAAPHPRIFAGHTGGVIGLAFTPDGRRLVSTSSDGSVRVWPIAGDTGERSRILLRREGAFQGFWQLAMASDGSFVALGNHVGQVVVLPLDGGPPRELSGFTDIILGLAVSPDARRVAAGAGKYNRNEALVRVWDLTTGEVQILDAGDGIEIGNPLRFNREGELFVWSGEKIRRWNLAGPTPRVVGEIDFSSAEFGEGSRFEDLTPDGREMLFSREFRLWVQDLGTKATREVSWVNEGSWFCGSWFDPTGRLVLSSNPQGIVGVASMRGGPPHLLLGHEGGPETEPAGPVAVSPDGRQIATGGQEGTIRLWPMPDLSKPPLQTLPRDELIAKLKSLTNLRAVPSPDSPTGWTIEADPFPGWEQVPTW